MKFTGNSDICWSGHVFKQARFSYHQPIPPNKKQHFKTSPKKDHLPAYVSEVKIIVFYCCVLHDSFEIWMQDDNLLLISNAIHHHPWHDYWHPHNFMKQPARWEFMYINIGLPVLVDLGLWIRHHWLLERM